MTEAPSRFRQLVASRIECPLCGAPDVDYEFVIERVGFSLCRACGLLFAKRNGASSPPALVDPAAEAIIQQLLRKAERYAGSKPKCPVIVGAFANTTLAGIDVRHHADLKPGEEFDLVVMLGSLERAEDPLELLADLSSRLLPGGTLAIVFPSTTSAEATKRRAGWPALRTGARYFFSPDTLQLLSTRAGLGEFLTFVDARDFAEKPSEKTVAWFRSHSVQLTRPVERDSTRLLSVIFPVFNEASTVEESLSRVLEKSIPGIELEVVIVESNSTDGSREIVEKYRDHPRVRLVHEDRPRGKGYAVRTGLQHARGEVILFQDADLEYDVEDYDVLVAPLFELRRNFVLGSRHDARGEAWKIRNFAGQPALSTITNLAHQGLLAMFNTLYAQRLRDPFTMYKVFRRDCLFGLSFECNRFDFDYEITIKLLRKGYQPVEIPINYSSRSFEEGKKVSFFADPPTWIRAMLRMRRANLYGKVLAKA